MKHIIIQIENVMKYPPTISLMKMLISFGDDVVLLTSEMNGEVKQICRDEKITLVDLGGSYYAGSSAFKKMIKIPKLNKSIKNNMNKFYESDSLIWIMTSISLKYIGKNLYGKKYVMYMYELSQEIRFYQKIPFLKVPLEKLFQNAAIVIECEYNRAHIAQAWFGLDKLPYVISNKPYMEPLEKESYIQNEYARRIISKIKNRKIIFYQGIIDDERPLDPFIEAVDLLGEEYALVVMSSDTEKLKEKQSRNLYLLPFVNPPHHLEVTSWAYIGILTYYPVREATTSPLNALYCAPNKLYEYAMFGMPMLGNDIPGLKYSVQSHNMGECFSSFDKMEIVKAIRKIEDNYGAYSKNAKLFYEKTNNASVLKKILKGERYHV